MVRSSTKRRLRYVHIEENQAEIARIQHALEAGGYDPQPLMVQTADELAAAIELPEWDLILTDLALTTFSAKAALAQLADRAIDLPIIVVSGAAKEEEIVDALKAGAHNYVVRDRLARLVPAIEQALHEDAKRKAYKLAEALRESYDGFHRLIEGAPLGVIILDEQSRFIKINQAFCHMVGYREDELLGHTYALVIHPDDLSQCITLADDMPDPQQPGCRVEKRYIRKDGQTIRVMVHPVNLALLGSRHHPLAAFIENVTERKDTEARLRLSKSSIDRAGEAIFWGDPSARIFDVNEAACALLGYSKDELCSLTVHDIVDNATPNLWLAYWTRLKQRKTVRFETLSRTKDGRIIPVDVVVNYLDFDGQAYGCAFVLDISARKQAEAALLQTQTQLDQSEKMGAIGRLAGGIAHDFNNLLTFINGQSELLLSGQVPANLARNSIEQIRDVGRQAARLTRQLLIFTQQHVVQPEAMDLNPVVKDMQSLLRRLIGEDIQIRLDLDDSLGRIMADSSQVEQILMNLMINARDAMPEGGTVTLETKNIELDAAFFAQQGMASRPGCYCLLSVRDTGTGMDEQTARRAFEPFFTTKALGKGTGLGLSTVYRIAREIHGVVTLSTQLGQGSTFRTYFPHTTSAVRQEVQAGSTLAADVRRTETILLIEDELLLRQLLQVVLSSRGYTILEAGTGKAAGDIASSHTGEIHLILSDVILPDARGPDVAEQLRAIRPGIKVLFMSGYLGMESDQAHSLTQQYSFIQKPFELPDLFETVHRVLESV